MKTSKLFAAFLIILSLASSLPSFAESKPKFKVVEISTFCGNPIKYFGNATKDPNTKSWVPCGKGNFSIYNCLLPFEGYKSNQYFPGTYNAESNSIHVEDLQINIPGNEDRLKCIVTGELTWDDAQKTINISKITGIKIYTGRIRKASTYDPAEAFLQGLDVSDIQAGEIYETASTPSGKQVMGLKIKFKLQDGSLVPVGVCSIGVEPIVESSISGAITNPSRCLDYFLRNASNQGKVKYESVSSACIPVDTNDGCGQYSVSGYRVSYDGEIILPLDSNTIVYPNGSYFDANKKEIKIVTTDGQDSFIFNFDDTFYHGDVKVPLKNGGYAYVKNVDFHYADYAELDRWEYCKEGYDDYFHIFGAYLKDGKGNRAIYLVDEYGIKPYEIYDSYGNLIHSSEIAARENAEGRETQIAAEKKKEQDEIDAINKQYNDLCKKYGQKDIDAIYDGKVYAGMSKELFDLAVDIHVTWSSKLEIDQGADKCYSVYSLGREIFYVWIRNNKITSVHWYN